MDSRIVDYPEYGDFLGNEVKSPSGLCRLAYGDIFDAAEPKDNRLLIFSSAGIVQMKIGPSVTRARIFDCGISLLDVTNQSTGTSSLWVLDASGSSACISFAGHRQRACKGPVFPFYLTPGIHGIFVCFCASDFDRPTIYAF